MISCLYSKRKSEGNGDSSQDEPDSKKAKLDDKDRERLKKQVKKIYYYRDMLARLSKKELEELLLYNEQEIPTGVDRVRIVPT